jgi:hypothetical protein
MVSGDIPLTDFINISLKIDFSWLLDNTHTSLAYKIGQFISENPIVKIKQGPETWE